jgi:AcrR family transcriptional regulator
MKERARPYHMTSRAASAEATHARILSVTQALFAERRFDELTLDAVAERAGVTLQTVLRRFGSKSSLVAAAAREGAGQVEAQRGDVSPGDLRAAVSNLFDHYEQWADVALRLVSQEDSVEDLRVIAARGRELHAAWVERVFEGALTRAPDAAMKVLRAQLIAVCDVTMWKLLRRDLQLSREDAEAGVLGLLRPLVASEVI